MAPPRKDLRRRDVKPALPTVDAAEVEALFDSIPDVLFFIKDREGRYTHVNATMLRGLLTGLTKADMQTWEAVDKALDQLEGGHG